MRRNDMIMEVIITILLVLGSVLSISSIFAMFGKAISHSDVGSSAFVNMFQAAFGQNASHTSNGGLLILFILTVVLIILGLILLIMSINYHAYYEMPIKMIISVISLSFVNAILSFCTKAFLDIPSGYGFKLGPGPLIYSIICIVSIILLSSALVLERIDTATNSTTNAYISNPNPCEKPSNNISDDAIVLAKYKKLLDDKAITRDEYNKIKNKILEK